MNKLFVKKITPFIFAVLVYSTILFQDVYTCNAENDFSTIIEQTEHVESMLQQLHETATTHLHDHEYMLTFGNQILSLANNFFHQGNIQHAIKCYQLLRLFFPQSNAIRYNLGRALIEFNCVDEAINMYQEIIKLYPHKADVLFSLSTAYLAQGNYEKGWKLYEQRWNLPDKQFDRFNIPRWDGHDITGKKILLRSEGDIGDIIQFIRYAQLVKNRGAFVILQAPLHLKQLLSTCPYIDQTIAYEDLTPDVEVQASLMSLPAIFGTTCETIPTNIPYFHPNKTLVQQWQEKIDCSYFNIGICWHAAPHNDVHRPPLAKRSIPLSIFIPLTTVPNVRIYSLQYIDGIDQLATISNEHHLYTFTPHLDTHNGRFMDTAAIMTILDLIITVDTSTAHLAGALGIPTWVLLPYKSDWRWMLNRTDSPWYPTIKLFRCPQNTDWSIVIENIVKTLHTLPIYKHKGMRQ